MYNNYLKEERKKAYVEYFYGIWKRKYVILLLNKINIW